MYSTVDQESINVKFLHTCGGVCGTCTYIYMYMYVCMYVHVYFRTQIDLPANYCADKASEIVHTMQIGAKDATGVASFKLLCDARNI